MVVMRFPFGLSSRRIARCAAFALVTCGLLSAAASAAPPSVRGRINGHDKLVPDVYIEASKTESRRYAWREPSPTVDAKFRVLSANPSRDICIVALAPQPQGPHDPLSLRVTGGRTIPSTVVVAPGTKIVFENVDPFPHRLYAVGLGTWKAETIAPGARREWSAPNGQARFEFRDEATPSLRSWVVVDDKALEMTFPTREGAFSFALNSGEYLLRAYFQGKQVGRSVSINVKERQVLDLKESLNVADGEAK